MTFSYKKQLNICLLVVSLAAVSESSLGSLRRQLWKVNSYEYLRALGTYGLVEPFQLPADGSFTPMENFTHCNCPRVYFPVCALNKVTYVNGCVMKCANQTSRRDGPCIIYRRRTFLEPVAFLREWENETHYRLVNGSFPTDDVL